MKCNTVLSEENREDSDSAAKESEDVEATDDNLAEDLDKQIVLDPDTIADDSADLTQVMIAT